MNKRSGLIGTKIGMSSYYDESESRVPVTIIKLSDCSIVSKKISDKDGYSAFVVSSESCRESSLSKPLQGFFKKNNANPKKHTKEFRVSDDAIDSLDVGHSFSSDYFDVGNYVDVVGYSSGKGFAGVMKRHNFRGLEASHGVSVSHRSHGSTGQNQDPGRVFKGKKMAGHMGCVRVTKQNLLVVSFDLENNIIIIKGSVPGAKGSRVYISDSIKKKRS
jgi:large subunit ribosomal protein L3